jgi:hypothetical protein
MADRNDKDFSSSSSRSTTLDTEHGHDANRDPLSGETGAHPVGTGVGAATGGTVGAVVGGAVGGPVGAMIGAAVGGLAGGLAGKGVAESVNPSEEDAFWRDNYSSRPYHSQDRSFDDYRPAYRYGWEARTRHEDRSWNDVENDLGSNWDKFRGESRLDWNDAKHATRDAWNRVDTRYQSGSSSAAHGAGLTSGTAGSSHSGLGEPVGDFTGRGGSSSMGQGGSSGGFTSGSSGSSGSAVTGTGSSFSGTTGGGQGGSFSSTPGSGSVGSLGRTTDNVGTTSAAGSAGGGFGSNLGPNTSATGYGTSSSSALGSQSSHFNDNEDNYWRQNYSSRPYFQSGRDYDEYRPAYQYGYNSANQYRGRRFEDTEHDLERGWESAKGNSRLMWHEVKDAVRDGWNRLERAMPGDADRDGR